MGQDVTNQARFCQLPQDSKKGINRHLKSRTIFMAASLTFILTTTGLAFYLTQSTPIGGLILSPEKEPKVYTPHSAIAIDGDANFSDTALLEGWPGDGSPENPFIINGLKIDLEYEYGDCIFVTNTRASFVIRNCNLTGAGFCEGFGPPFGGCIILFNTSSGELVNNTCNNNIFGIYLYSSYSNTVANNTCINNAGGIDLIESDHNTVANNTCINNAGGIDLIESDHNTVANNTCINNKHGIHLRESDHNTVANNTCLGNPKYDIYIRDSDSNTLANNIIGIPNEFVTVVLLLIGLVGIIVLGAVFTTRLDSTSDVVRNKQIQLNNRLKDN